MKEACSTRVPEDSSLPLSSSGSRRLPAACSGTLLLPRRCFLRRHREGFIYLFPFWFIHLFVPSLVTSCAEGGKKGKKKKARDGPTAVLTSLKHNLILTFISAGKKNNKIIITTRTYSNLIFQFKFPSYMEIVLPKSRKADRKRRSRLLILWGPFSLFTGKAQMTARTAAVPSSEDQRHK